MSDPTEPVASPIPKFKKGEVIRHQGTQAEHKILEIDKDSGGLRLEGVANLVHPSAVEKL
jgi:hypothetical protein